MRTLEAKMGITLVLCLGAVTASGRTAGAGAAGSEAEKDPKAAFAKLEARLPGLDEGKRRRLLGDLATAAFDAGETAKATRFASELVSPAAAAQGWARGNEIHIGHLVLGRLSLRAGDLAAAKQELLEAGRTPGSPQLDNFGPNMLLAKELLERGERKAVVDYLVLCAKFWRSGRDRGVLTEWAAVVQRGELPNFGANLRYLWFNPQRGSVLDEREPPGGRALTEGERRVIAEVEARVKEAARKELLAIYVELKGAPTGTPTVDELERAIVEALPREELSHARVAAIAHPTTAAERYVAVRRGITSEVVAQLTRRIPHPRMSAVLAAYVTPERRSAGTRAEK